MVTRGKSREVFSKLLKDSEMCSIDASGISRGFFSGWNPVRVDLVPCLSMIGILLEGRVNDWDEPLKLLNCYGRYLGHRHFGILWKGLVFYLSQI